MSMIFYPPGFELYVDNPGHGELIVRVSTNPDVGEPLTRVEWHDELYGPRIGDFLTRVTDRALGIAPDKDSGDRLPRFLTTAAARTLLPALQRAVVLATGGTDRYEHLYPDPEEAPLQPLCARCNLGTPFTPGARQSEWCDQHGHSPFGSAVNRWEHAQEMHQLEVERWEREKRRRRELAEFEAGVTNLAAERSLRRDGSAQAAPTPWCEGIGVVELGPDGRYPAARCGSTSTHSAHSLNAADDEASP